MKNLSMMVAFICLVLSKPAWSVNGVDNGGEYLALEFTRLGREVLLALERFPKANFLDAKQMSDFKFALESTRVNGVKGPIRDNSGREVDARVVFDEHYQELVIEIDKFRWQIFINERIKVHQLTMHEYLRAAKINDDNYVISSKLISEPFAGFLKIRKPDIGGEQNIYSQLERYFSLSILPQNIIDSSWTFYCYHKDSRRPSSTPSVSVKNISNGPIFDPIPFLRFGNGTSSIGYELFVIKNSYMNKQKTIALRSYGHYLIARIESEFFDNRHKRFCYAW